MEVTQHVLKIHSEHFRNVKSGKKRAEFRKNDRDFKEGDYLLLRENDPDVNIFTGKEIRARITCINDLSSFISEPYVMLSIEVLE